MHNLEKTLRSIDAFLAKLPYVWLLLIPPLVYSRMNLGFHGDVHLYFLRSSELLGLAAPGKATLEYPILAFIPMMLPRILMYSSDDFMLYKNLFIAENTLLLLIAYALLRQILREYDFTFLHIRLVSFVGVAWIFQLLYFRFDLFPVVLTLLAFSSFAKARSTLSGIHLALGVLAKLYPLVLIYVCSVALIAQKRYKNLLFVVAGILLATTVSVLAFVYWKNYTFASLLNFISPHANRGIQIESTPASIAYLHHLLAGFHLNVIHNYGSHNIVYSLSQQLVQPLFPLFVLAISLLSVLIWRNERNRPALLDKGAVSDLAAYFVLILGCFIIFNKVFSPQYLIWLLPFVFLLPLELLFTFLIVIALTALLYPFLYVALMGLKGYALFVQIIRNGILILVLSVMFVKYCRKAPRFWLKV